MQKQSLDGFNWSFRDTKWEKWYPAQVPGTVFADMMTQGLLVDPYYRFNEEKLMELGKQDYEYQCTFCVTPDLLAQKEKFLVFEGIDTIATVILNDVEIGKTDNMHRTYRFNVCELLRANENHIRVILYSPVAYIARKHKENPLPEFNSASLNGFSQIRKIHSAFRWDAEPLVPDSGLWRSVYIEGYCEIHLESLHIRQRHLTSGVFLDVFTEAKIAHGIKSTAEIVLKNPQGEVYRVCNISVANGTNLCSIHVESPQLWWPNGYGSQPLYEINVCLASENGEKTFKSAKVGIRKAFVKRETDQWGESFAFYINDVPIFAKGACYTPPDKFLTLCRGKRHEDLIKHCAAANYNCIRVWGGAVYPDDEFFDLCDQYGLLVWQDLMFACALYHVTEEFAENIRKEVRQNVIRLRNHPSLMLWCGSNENEWFHDYEHDSEGLTNKLRMDNLRQYEVILKDVVNTFDPDRLYWPSSPSSGGGYEDPNGYEKGDVHCWYVWYLPAKPYTFYRECTGRFISEYGLESFQSVKTLRHYMEEEDLTPNSEVMDYMQHCSDNHCDMGNGKIMNYVFQEVRVPKNFEEYVYATQYAQAEGIKYASTHFRRLKPRCMGSLYWQIVDCFPGTTWSGLDYEYRWKILHYYAKRFFAQIIISADIIGDKAAIYVINDDPKSYGGTIEWQLKDHTGHVICGDSQKVVIEKSSSKCFIELDFEDRMTREMRRKTYLEICLKDDSGNILSSDTTLFIKPKHFAFLDSEVTFSIDEKEDEFLFDIEAPVYTKCIQLDFEKEEGIFSDNCFDLSPGQKKTIILNKSSLSRPMTRKEVNEELKIYTLNHLGRKF